MSEEQKKFEVLKGMLLELPLLETIGYDLANNMMNFDWETFSTKNREKFSKFLESDKIKNHKNLTLILNEVHKDYVTEQTGI